MFILNIAFCWNNGTEMTLKQETHGISTHQSFLEDCKFITVYYCLWGNWYCQLRGVVSMGHTGIFKEYQSFLDWFSRLIDTISDFMMLVVCLSLLLYVLVMYSKVVFWLRGTHSEAQLSRSIDPLQFLTDTSSAIKTCLKPRPLCFSTFLQQSFVLLNYFQWGVF